MAFAELKAEYYVKTLPACLAGIVAAVAVSLLFQRLVLRTLRNAAAIVRVIATVGLLGLVQALVIKRYSDANLPVEQYLPHDVWRWGDVSIQEERLYLVAISLLVTVGLWAWTRCTRTGLAIAPVPRTSGPSRRGWSPDASPPLPGASAAPSPASPPCWWPRSPASPASPSRWS